MPIPREDLIRLLVEIDQQLAGLRELLEALEIQSDEAKVGLYRTVCLHAARLMVEEKLNAGENPNSRTGRLS